jgi:hypothetical protein
LEHPNLLFKIIPLGLFSRSLIQIRLKSKPSS